MVRGKRPKFSPSGGAKPKQFTRDTATYEFRQKALQYFATHSIKETLAKMYPRLDPAARETKRKSIYYWRKVSAKVERASSSSKTSRMKKLRPMGTMTVLPRDTELQLVKRVNEYRTLGAPVSALMLHFKALDFAEQADLSRQAFAASWAWRKEFIKRHRLSFRARIRQGQKSPEDNAKAVAELNKTMKETMLKLDVQEAYNPDQTPIFFEYVPK